MKLGTDELGVVYLFKEILLAPEPIALVESQGPNLVAAADAFAEDSSWGIGGWFLPAGAALQPENIYYYTIQGDVGALPSWFMAGERGIQRKIAALEALAQLVLLDGQKQHLQEQIGLGWISLRQACGNAGVVGASHKGLSLKQPLASVLQSMAVFACRRKINLRIAHVAGARNHWADALSRGPALDPEFFAALDPAKRLVPDWEALLTLGRRTVSKKTGV